MTRTTHSRRLAHAVSFAALTFATSPALAALAPIFEYRFPESYDGTTTTLTDTSAAGHDGYMQSTNAFLPNERPPGFTEGGSIHGRIGGRAMTNGIDLLDHSLVAAAGGYTVDTWVKWDEDDFGEVDGEPALLNSQFFSYAGTDVLMSVSGRLAAGIYFDDGLGNFVLNFVFGPVVEPGQWYHVVSEFNSAGNVIDGNGYLQGELSFTVDGVLQEGSVSGPWHTIGDDIDRQIGLNAWPGDPQFQSLSFASNAKLFNPSAYLGIADAAPGDFDGDDDVDGDDFLAWQRGESPNNGSDADFDEWAMNFGTPAVAAGAAAPEPAGASLAAAAAVAWAASRGARRRSK